MDDTLKWVKKAKKKEKELAKKRAQELENMDKLHQDEYTESKQILQRGGFWSIPLMPLSVGDLVGLKVSHDFEGLGEGEDRILTLRDSRILDNEGTVFPFRSLSWPFRSRSTFP